MTCLCDLRRVCALVFLGLVALSDVLRFLQTLCHIIQHLMLPFRRRRMIQNVFVLVLYVPGTRYLFITSTWFLTLLTLDEDPCSRRDLYGT